VVEQTSVGACYNLSRVRRPRSTEPALLAVRRKDVTEITNMCRYLVSLIIDRLARHSSTAPTVTPAGTWRAAAPLISGGFTGDGDTARRAHAQIAADDSETETTTAVKGSHGHNDGRATAHTAGSPTDVQWRTLLTKSVLIAATNVDRSAYTRMSYQTFRQSQNRDGDTYSSVRRKSLYTICLLRFRNALSPLPLTTA